MLHSLDLARHVSNVAGEADFVVIVPEHGILVIEVKSHRSVLYDERGWHLGRDPVDYRGPFKQASEAMHSIRNYLLDIDGSFGSLIMWSAVCFTELDFRQKSSEWHDWQVINRSRLTGAPVSRLVLEILARGRHLLATRGLPCAQNSAKHATRNRCESASRALRPRFELAMSLKALRKETDDTLLRLTEEQFTALDQASLNRRIVFAGPAGSGKTVLAMEALRRSVCSGESRNAAFFCYNRFLGDQIREKAKDTAPGAVAGNIDGWLSEVARPCLRPDDRKRSDFFDGLLASRAIDAILASDGQEHRFDFVVVDEAQDLLRPHYLDVLDIVLEGGLAGGRWTMFGDFIGQDIFSKGAIGLEEFVEDRCPSAARFLLNTNCRNTRAISEYVVTFGKLTPPYAKVLRPDDRMDPELEFWSSSEQQRQQVVRFIRKCEADGFSLGDIVLLSPRKANSLAGLLRDDPAWLGKIVSYPGNPGKIGYTTIQAFKGLEAPVVLVTDFEAMDSDHQQSLFYIGLSRALHRLGVFLHTGLKSFVRSIT